MHFSQYPCIRYPPDPPPLSEVQGLSIMSTGENLPSAFGALKTELGEAASDSNKLLRAFLFTALCVMGGAMGAATLEGCMFLDAERGRQVAMAIEAIGDLTGDPVEIFWTKC